MKKGYEDRCVVCDKRFHNTGLDDMCPDCEREIFSARMAEGDVEPTHLDKEYTLGIYEDAEGEEAQEVSVGMLDAPVADFTEELIDVMDSSGYMYDDETFWACDVAYQGRVN